MRIFAFVLLLLSSTAFAQQNITGVIADSLTRQPLPFATIQQNEKNKSVISSITGGFSFTISQPGNIRFSYIGYHSKNIPSSTLKSGDTVFLHATANSMETVVIHSLNDKIKRIINTSISNQPVNNPDNYRQYECNVYYKMTLDMELMDHIDRDSLQKHMDSVRTAARKKRGEDPGISETDTPAARPGGMYMLLTETFSKRLYKKPQLQEIVLASRFSGLKKTYFANIVTDILPFHIYQDLIPLNGKNYVNPVAKGWQRRYRFILEDEIIIGTDTVFMLSFAPRTGVHFNGLSGFVYISSNGYAISHIIASTADEPGADRFIRFEHIYTHEHGKWFPRELNYHFLIRRVPAGFLQIVWNGHSLIDSVLFDRPPSFSFDKTKPVKLHDSVDLHSESDWQNFRKDTMTQKESNTYTLIDSLMENTPMGKVVLLGARMATGLFPIGKFDIDVRRIAFNRYEGFRLGVGIYTNNKISKYFSIGGWAGYGFKDKNWKYGSSATIYPNGDKDNWLKVSYQQNIRTPGQVDLHPELTKTLLRNLLFGQVDQFREYAISANIKAGYWGFTPAVIDQEIHPLHYHFNYRGKLLNVFNSRQANLGVRFAFNEKRVPFFEYYVPVFNYKYPVFYFKFSTGEVKAPGYKTRFISGLAAVTYQLRKNRWGQDRFRLELGWIKEKNDEALPRSFLFAGNGFKRGEGASYYAWGGFLTMRPFDYYGDRYVSFLYRHDFDKYFWDFKWSKPSLSLGHNMIYGNLSENSRFSNEGVRRITSGYHESGLIINQLLRMNFRVWDAGLNAGVYYHWTNKWQAKNASWLIGVTFGF